MWLPIKLRVMNVEYNIINLLPIGKNINAYPREEKYAVMTPV